jgi:hypothetical protein
MAYTDIDKPSDYFNTVLYTGTESSGKTVTGVGFQPNWIWIKNRTDATNHSLYDSVRGGNGTSHYFLKSNVANAEGTNTSSLLTIDSDGFTLGDGNEVNGSSDNIVSWNWLAGGSASSNSDGNTTTTVSVNQTAGFSIMKWAGDGNESTIGHGLGAEPEYIIFKEIDGAESWRVWSKYTPDTASKALALNLTDGAFSQTNWIGTISSSIITIGSDSSINTSGNNYIGYAFSPKKGYSKFGSYTGNGSTDGAFIYTGFKPAFFMLKRTNGAEDWVIYDNKRDPINKAERILRPNATNADSTGFFADILSNGFKLRIASEAKVNGSGDTYIYMAFAESPFVTSTGIPTTAR